MGVVTAAAVVLFCFGFFFLLLLFVVFLFLISKRGCGLLEQGRGLALALQLSPRLAGLPVLK